MMIRALSFTSGAACLALLVISACGGTTEERAATGALRDAVTGTVSGGPVGAAIGAAVGAATDTTVGMALDRKAEEEVGRKEGG